MIKKTVLKNSKNAKSRRFHIKSILYEIKNKCSLEEIDRQIQMNNSVNKGRKTSVIPKNKNEHCYDSRIQKNKYQHKNSSLNSSILKQPRRKNSSKMQLQLQQIIQYSKLCQNIISSSRSVQGRIKKLLNVKPIKFVGKQNTNQMQQKQWENNTNQKRKSKSNVLTVAQKEYDNTVLYLVDDNAIREREQQRKNKVQFLLKKSKEICNKNKHEHDYSLEGFVENQLNATHLRHGRKTVGYTSRSSSKKDKSDVREEKIHEMHTFFRNDYGQDCQYSDSINIQQIQNFKSRFEIYNGIYNKTRDALNNQTLNVKEMKELTLRNAVYINELKYRSNVRLKRGQVGKVMKKLHFYQ